MANKVLSIKMDEKDIERLKKYYEVLVKAGYLSSKTMSLNAFYKHLLLDYLEEDVKMAFAAYSEYGQTPRCIDPDSLNRDGGLMLSNTYNLSSETFEIYKKCIQEQLSKNLEEMNRNADQFNEVLKTGVFVDEGIFHELRCFPYMDSDERESSFWENKVFENMDLLDTRDSKESKISEVDEEIAMIRNASVTEDAKEQLIKEMLAYKEKVQQNRTIIRGGRFVG